MRRGTRVVLAWLVLVSMILAGLYGFIIGLALVIDSDKVSLKGLGSLFVALVFVLAFYALKIRDRIIGD